MQLTVHTFLTLDGVMQGPGGAEEDRSGGFSRGGWLVPHVDEDFGAIVSSWFARADAILLGRNTFMSMREYWTQVTDPDNPAAVALNGLPKYLVSSTVTEPDWGDTIVLSGDPIEQVRALKHRPGTELEDAPPTGFRLLESRTTSMGVIYASLAPSEFTTGAVAVEEGREAV